MLSVIIRGGIRLSDKKGIQTGDNLIDDEDYEYEKSLADQARAAREREQELYEQQLEAKKRQEKLAEKEREERLKRERLELMKLRSGVIDEEESTIKEEHHEKTELHGKAWIANFIYHYKFMIIFIVFMLAAAVFILIDTLRRERADLTVVVISNNGLETRNEELEEFFEKYTDDLDGNGYVHVDVIMAPQGPNTSRYLGQDPDNTKLLAALQEGKDILFITDSNTDEEFMQLMDPTLPSRFPDSKYIDEDGLSLNFGFLAEELRFENMPNDVHLSMRYPTTTFGDSKETMQENYDKSMKTLEKMLADLTERAEQTNDQGLETEPIHYEEGSSQAEDSSSH